LAFLFFVTRPGETIVVPLAFDLTTVASLEADCARGGEAHVFMLADQEQDRSYSFGDWLGHYQVRVAYGAEAAGDDRSATLLDLKADSVRCGFECCYPGFLEVQIEGWRTLADTEGIVRQVAAAGSAAPAEVAEAVSRFETGDTWNTHEPAGFHTFVLDGERFDSFFMIGDLKGGRERPERSSLQGALYHPSFRLTPKR
jgi:hypothetical protein